MWVKHIHGLNLYTDKVPIAYGYKGDTKKSGREKIFKRCSYCDSMKTPKEFGKLVRNICSACVEEICDFIPVNKISEHP